MLQIILYGVAGYLFADELYWIGNLVKRHLGGRKLPISQSLDYDIGYLKNMKSIGPISLLLKRRELEKYKPFQKMAKLNEEIEKGLRHLK